MKYTNNKKEIIEVDSLMFEGVSFTEYESSTEECDIKVVPESIDFSRSRIMSLNAYNNNLLNVVQSSSRLNDNEKKVLERAIVVIDAHEDKDSTLEEISIKMGEVASVVSKYDEDKTIDCSTNDVREYTMRAVTGCLKDDALDILMRLMGVISWKRFPGVHFAGLGRGDMNRLKRYCCYLSRKIDGTRHIVWVSNGRCWMVNRAMEVVLLPLLCPDLRETVIDCEVQYVVDTLVINVLDCMVYRDNNIMRQSFKERIKLLSEIVLGFNTCRNWHTFDEGQNLVFKEQIYFPSVEIKKVVDMIDNSIMYDGIVINPAIDPSEVGFSRKMFKWKSADRETIDFRVRVRQGVKLSDLCLDHYENNVRRSVVYCVSNDLQLLSRDGLIVECSKIKNQWSFVRDREDKKSPNNIMIAKDIENRLVTPILRAELVRMFLGVAQGEEKKNEPVVSPQCVKEWIEMTSIVEDIPTKQKVRNKKIFKKRW